ncbi:hypothetical protein QN277_001134 [Acacia crassicarpa]|uniref:Uncharacterized protein n=1 Tax=Acacia crassicarpa TaxID=499986 RepID=A0AAE1N830_9FABA|nr:hypothetical protein QN277_001134 [Acacia crassicarpa]
MQKSQTKGDIAVNMRKAILIAFLIWVSTIFLIQLPCSTHARLLVEKTSITSRTRNKNKPAVQCPPNTPYPGCLPAAPKPSCRDPYKRGCEK